MLRGNGDGSFQSAKSYSSGANESASVAIGDLNGDGRPDLAVAEESEGVSVLLNELTVATKTALAASPDPAAINQPVAFTATVSASPAVPNGEAVTFDNGSTVLGTATTANGTASLTTSFSKAKTHTIKADYPGDAFRKKSSGSAKLVVNQ